MPALALQGHLKTEISFAKASGKIRTAAPAMAASRTTSWSQLAPNMLAMAGTKSPIKTKYLRTENCGQQCET